VVVVRSLIFVGVADMNSGKYRIRKRYYTVGFVWAAYLIWIPSCGGLGMASVEVRKWIRLPTENFAEGAVNDRR
jgi:hypothetical protein